MDYQQFVADFRAADAWIDSLVTDIEAVELPLDLVSAEAVCQHHTGLKAEIDARRPAHDAIAVRGEAMVVAGHHRAEELNAQLADLSSSLEKLNKVWKHRAQEFQETFELRGYESAGRRARAALDRQEAYLDRKSVV